jgi:hypothetical protein
LWFDTTNQQLKVYSGSPGLGIGGWITVGPAASAALGSTEFKPDLILNASTGGSVPVLTLRVNGTTLAVISSLSFITSLQGFNVIIPGINFAQGLGLALDTQDVAATPNTIAQRDEYGGLNATGLSLSGTNPVITGASQISTATGGAITASTGTFDSTLQADTVTAVTGLSGNLTTYTATVSTAVIPSANGTASIGSISRYFGNIYTNNLTLSNPLALTTANISTLRVTGLLVPSANVSGGSGIDVGTNTLWFRTIYGKSFVGTSISANYADLAERFASDREYSPGTVVEIGGDAEITESSTDLSESVFGVISTNAAYLMNSGAGPDSTHPPVAVQGRVPVRVIGTVRKGDRLVSAGGGVARVGRRSEITAWNVIGRALEDKTTDTVELIEAVVRVN